MNAHVHPVFANILNSMVPAHFTADNARDEISRLPLTVANLRAVVGEVAEMARQMPGAWDVHAHLLDAFAAIDSIGPSDE